MRQFLLRLAGCFLTMVGLFHVALALGSIIAGAGGSTSPLASALYGMTGPEFTLAVSPLSLLMALVLYSRAHWGISLGGGKKVRL